MAEDINSDFENIKDKARDLMEKGMEKTQGTWQKVENLARQNTEEAKQKLLSMAREKGIYVNEGMGIGEIKNRIKTKMRNM